MKVHVFLLGLISVLSLSACNSSNNPRSPESPPPATAPMPTAARVCDVNDDIRDYVRAAQYQKVLDETVDLGFPGISALIFTLDEGLWMGSSGYADVQQQTALNTCNVMFSGSVAKTYTAVAALGLMENGMLALDDSIADYLPDSITNNLPNGRTATIRQLLNHTAGMPDHDDEEDLSDYVDANEGHLPSAEEQLAYLYDNEARFPAGTAPAYSSAHTLVLSLVLDNAAGEHHSNLFSRNIIEQLGLEDTYYKNDDGFRADLVRGYIDADNVRTDITEASINYALDSQGDAGIMATAYDYFQFIRGVFENELLMPDTVSMMQETNWLFNDGDAGLGFGLGLFSVASGGEIVKLGHSGSTAGGMSHVYYYPTINSYIVLLTNTLILDDSELLQTWGANIQLGAEHDSVMTRFEHLIGIE